VQSTLPGVNLVSRIPTGLFRDTMSFRIGANYPVTTSTRTSIILRTGIAAEPTMLAGKIQGRTNLVDGDKLTVGLGATFVAKNMLGKALRIGFGGNGQFVSDFVQEKRSCQTTPCPETSVAGPDASSPSSNITNPGYPRLSASGALFTLSLGVGVDF
jgi:long-subunit fatty acid transport protein